MDIINFCHHPNFWAPVDWWQPLQDDIIFKQVKNAIILPISDFYGVKQSRVLDSFMLTPKRCYNSDEIRKHICQYLNYFERFYGRPGSGRR